MPPADLELLRGTLDLLILKALSAGPRHGLEVMRWIEHEARDRLQIEEGALYPALHRLEGRGLLESAWGHTDAGRRAKYYRLTPAGRKHLAAEVTRWSRYAQTIGLVLSAEVKP